MPELPSRAEVGFRNADEMERFRELLERAGYTEARVLAEAGVRKVIPDNRTDFSDYLYRSERRSPLDVLIHLFLIGIPLPAEEIRAAVAPVELETLVVAGLLEPHPEGFAPAVRLRPFRHLWLAHDLPNFLKRATHRDFVMGIGDSTEMLVELANRSRMDLTLDLGTGCGVHALLAAAHSRKAYGVDLNARAVQIARFNAGLNGVENTEFLRGNLIEPVREQRFDLILSNPPFVISPSSRYIFRDGGLPGDGFCQRLISEAPSVLAENGYLLMLCNWAQHKGQDWKERVSRWFEDSGCDAWILSGPPADASAYARDWIRSTEPDVDVDDLRCFAGVYREWMDFYRQEGIEAIHSGSIFLRRSGRASPWIRFEEAPERLHGPAGEDVIRGFAVRDLLEDWRDDSRWLDLTPRMASEVRLEQACISAGTQWKIQSTKLVKTQGLGFAGLADPRTLLLLSRCDGTISLRQVVAEAAQTWDVSPEAITAPVLDVVRKMLQQGFLEPDEWVPAVTLS